MRSQWGLVEPDQSCMNKIPLIVQVFKSDKNSQSLVLYKLWFIIETFDGLHYLSVELCLHPTSKCVCTTATLFGSSEKLRFCRHVFRLSGMTASRIRQTPSKTKICQASTYTSTSAPTYKHRIQYSCTIFLKLIKLYYVLEIKWQ